jgi:hypothetical protein
MLLIKSAVGFLNYKVYDKVPIEPIGSQTKGLSEALKTRFTE